MIESGAKIVEWIMIISNTILIFWLSYKLNQFIKHLFGLEVQRNPVIDRWAWKLILIGYLVAFMVMGIFLLMFYWAVWVIILIIWLAGKGITGSLLKQIFWPFKLLGAIFRR
jgi:hypothetical protein